MKKNDLILMAIIAIVAVAGLGFYALSRDDESTNNMMSSNETSMMEPTSSMTNMDSTTYNEYAALKGEEYDRLFLSNMIAHHQGAVSMAELALTSANHQEIKDLSTAIVSAQTAEIKDMTSWQSQWGYPGSSGEAMMDHSAMGMMMVMDGMAESLKGLTGDAFDKQFLSSMIEHHQSAIDMAVSGEANAYHSEVKTLTKAIVTAQSKEIAQMKQWQNDWNFVN